MVYLPNYKDGSIVNLMSSIGKTYGSRSQYKELKILPSSELKNSKNIVLIIFDGLGYEYIKKKGKGTVFDKYLKGNMTSVFPSTTAAAITSFYTGTAPKQHAYTGWFMLLKELGVVATILPFTPRYGGVTFSNEGYKKTDVLSVKAFTEKINVKSFLITKNEISRSDYTKTTSKKSRIIPYSDFNDFFIKIAKTIKSDKKRKYIQGYCPDFDSISHEYGIKSKKAENCFFAIEKGIAKLIKNIEGTNTTLIITADHGLLDTTKQRTIYVEKHPRLKECLTLPLCGDARVAYCYVHPDKTKQFEKYVKTKLKYCCNLYKSKDLIKMNYFGLFKEDKRLIDRIGDYTIIMKYNYCILDKILNKKRHYLIGHHSGRSKDEMLVPLIVIKT
jgi:predicted AlkP superfamily pyrophosphatase or phosphodiesterase